MIIHLGRAWTMKIMLHIIAAGDWHTYKIMMTSYNSGIPSNIAKQVNLPSDRWLGERRDKQLAITGAFFTPEWEKSKINMSSLFWFYQITVSLRLALDLGTSVGLRKVERWSGRPPPQEECVCWVKHDWSWVLNTFHTILLWRYLGGVNRNPSRRE